MATCSLAGGRQVAQSWQCLALLRQQAAGLLQGSGRKSLFIKSELSEVKPCSQAPVLWVMEQLVKLGSERRPDHKSAPLSREFHRRGNTSTTCLSPCHVPAAVLSSLVVLSYLILKANPMRQVLLCPLDGCKTGADETD